LDPDPLGFIISLFIFDSAFLLKVGILILLLICSALISGAEVAFFGLSPTTINEIDEQKTTRGSSPKSMRIEIRPVSVSLWLIL